MIRSLQLLRNNLVNHDNSKRSSCVCGGSVGYRQGEIILYIYIYIYIILYIVHMICLSKLQSCPLTT